MEGGNGKGPRGGIRSRDTQRGTMPYVSALPRRLSALTVLSSLNCKYRHKVSLSELNITPHLWKLVSATILQKVKKKYFFFPFFTIVSLYLTNMIFFHLCFFID